MNLMNKSDMNEIEIEVNGVEYVPKDSVQEMAVKLDGMKYVICRTYSAGVFAGYLESRVGKESVMRHARRIYYWAGAATLSQLAMTGPMKPNDCKFAMPADRVELIETIEILDCTESAKKSIEGVKIWRM